MPVEASSQYLLLGDPWPPWATGDYGVAKGGIAVDVTRYILNRLNADVEIQLHPWKRVLRMTEYGYADGIIMIQPSDQTTKFLTYTDPIFVSQEVICYNKLKLPDFNWDQFSDLKKYKIGTTLGYFYGGFSEAVKKYSINTEPAKSLKINLNKLVLGRTDLVVCDNAALKKQIDENPEFHKSIAVYKRPVHIWKYSMGISKNSGLLKKINEINKIIEEIQNNGILDKIKYESN